MSDQPPLAPAEIVGGYELLGEIDRGGMGIVYKARERQSGRLVALKMMLRERAESGGDLRRFELEARATGELNHLGIVAIHSWGEHRGNPYYTMDYVPGVSLSRRLEQGPLPLEQAVRYLVGIAQAVAAAHELGIVHRDLKPSNIIIDLSDHPRVLDFGLAKRQHIEEPSRQDEILDALPATESLPATVSESTGQNRTEVGAILGTPAYMAPEQVRAEHEQVGPPADVHSLGAIFFEMVTGQPPFHGGSTYDTLMLVLKQPAPSLRALRPQAPVELEEFCSQCLAKDPRDRHADAGVVADDLARRWKMCRSLTRFRRLTWAAALVLIVLHFLSLLGANWWSGDGDKLTTWSAAWAPDSPVMQGAAGLLANGVAALVVVVAPYLAELGLIVWLAGWVWHAERPARVAGAWTVIAAAVVLLSLLPGLSVWQEGPLFLAWMAVANALVAGVVMTYRLVSPPRQAERDTARRRADPYLARLLVNRVDAPAAPTPGEGLADFELGKVLHRWDSDGRVHEVRWGRQRSLDRAVLVWMDRVTSAEGRILPGVVVRHPSVLVLHAVGSGPEGRYLVTEASTASPLAEAVQQRGLVPEEAAVLAVRLAEAVQAFHDQEACHGRLTPDWVLLRGELEPLLCPCGVPSQSAEERTADVRALGEMLRSWLPTPTRGSWWGVLGPLHRFARTACQGGYRRAADLAADLQGVIEEMRARWRQQWGQVLLALLLAVPLILPLLGTLARRGGLVDAESAGWLPELTSLSPGYALVSLLPAAVMLGLIWGRGLGWRLRRRKSRVASRSWRDGGTLGILLSTAAFGLTVALLVGGAALGTGFQVWPAGLVLLVSEYGAAWLLGVGLAAIWTFAEGLLRSLRWESMSP